MPWPENNRWVDYAIAVFYSVALLVIYLVEIEQVIISDPQSFTYPVWPPGKLIDITHWWGENYHSALYYRPGWYKATIWVDLIFSGPVYVLGIFAFIRKWEWIRYPAMIQAILLIVIVIFSGYQEIYGEFAGENAAAVLTSMLPWLVVPCIVVWRTWEIKRQEVNPG